MRMKNPLSMAISMAVLGVNTTAIPSLAFAQEDGKNTELMEEVTVTGSRIKRQDYSSLSPVVTVGEERISLAGAISTEQLINQMPQVVPGLTNTSNNPGDGTASVDLRGLGARRTLVLVNGRRMVPTGQDGTVDINNIPSALIDRVEVVTGGASAVYGSDAVAGVVNFIMKSDFEGVEIDSKWAETSDNDGARYDIGITMGSNFADDKGNVALFFGYTDREEVFQGDRKFSSVALGDSIGSEPYLYPFGSSGIPQGYLGGRAGRAGAVGASRFLPNGDRAPYSSATDTYNFAPSNYLQLPQERYTFNTFANYEINDKVDIYSEALYVQHETPQQLAPTPAFIGGFDFNYAINPYLTDATKQYFEDYYDQNLIADANGVNPGDPGYINTWDDIDGVARIGSFRRRLLENNVRSSFDELSTYRFLLGSRGEITGSWSYDGYFSYGKVKRTNRLEGDASQSRFIAGMNTADGVNCVNPNQPDVIIPGCVPVNPWGQGNISQEAVDYFNVGATNITTYEQKIISLSATGDLFTLPAGAVGMAVGYEHRSEDSTFTPDEFLASGDVLGFNAGEPTVGGFNVSDFFLEVNVPIIDSLSANLAYRYSDYSNIGNVNTYAYGFDFTAIEGLRFRAQAQRAIRAPSVLELFEGLSNGFPGYSDPCADGVTGALRDFCIATGVPEALIDGTIVNGKLVPFTAANSQVEATFGGVSALKEEVSDSLTAGVIWQPAFVEGLSLTLDWYKVEIEDAIGFEYGGANNRIKLCYEGLDINNPACDTITRGNDGQISLLQSLNANISERIVEGIDIQAEYDFSIPFGIDGGDANLHLAFLGTHYAENSFVAGPGVESVDCAGRFGSPCGVTVTGTATPENKVDTSLTYMSGGLTTRLGMNWIDGVTDIRVDQGTPKSTLPVPEIGSFTYWELSSSYELTDYLQLSAGIVNLTDKEPPVYGDQSIQANTDPSTYDVLGRRIWLGAKVSF